MTPIAKGGPRQSCRDPCLLSSGMTKKFAWPPEPHRSLTPDSASDSPDESADRAPSGVDPDNAAIDEQSVGDL